MAEHLLSVTGLFFQEQNKEIRKIVYSLENTLFTLTKYYDKNLCNALIDLIEDLNDIPLQVNSIRDSHPYIKAYQDSIRSDVYKALSQVLSLSKEELNNYKIICKDVDNLVQIIIYA